MERDTGYKKQVKGTDGKLYDTSLQEIEQAMGGPGYQIERYDWGGFRGTGKKTYTYSVYPLSAVTHQYEVARWNTGRVKDTATVTYDEHTATFDCTCKNQRQKRRRDAIQRGYCDHIDKLTLHAARRLPTLEAPARQIAALYKEKPQWSIPASSTSTPVPSATETALSPTTLTPQDLARARTVFVSPMPVTGTPGGRH